MKERVNIVELPTQLVAELIEAKKFGKTAEILAEGMKRVKEEKKGGDKDDKNNNQRSVEETS
ncbi:hypothetical protein M0R04_10305 [Candidatus Dojkabacteria bacterium]|jgi:hypothetical protein|nr:hypothetical protein [Candidatus Dojkabacteria bacterium]